MSLYFGKETGVTEAGSKYIILQDAPDSFHVSVLRGDVGRYDHFQQLISKEEIMNNIALMEIELLAGHTTQNQINVTV